MHQDAVSVWVEQKLGSQTTLLLQQFYAQPHRHYHTWQHLVAMWQELEPYFHRTAHEQEMQLALVYHDAVYETSALRYSQNEEESAQLLLKHTEKKVVAGSSAALAASFVRATKHHCVDQEWARAAAPSQVQAMQWFLDADMSILAKPHEQVQLYDEQISREWDARSTPQKYAVFKNGRRRALMQMLEGPIFMSPEFAHMEQQARENVQHLIKVWS